MTRLFYFNPYASLRNRPGLLDRLSGSFDVTDGLHDRVVVHDVERFQEDFDVIWVRAYFRPFFGRIPWRDREMFKLHEWFNIIVGLGGGRFRDRCFQRPANALVAESKPLQLATAKEVGFTVPATTITNDWTAARGFGESLEWDAIMKPIDNTAAPDPGDPTRTITLFTSAIHPDAFPEPTADVDSPVIFQERVAKKFELRVVCVGDRAVLIKVDSQADDRTRLDYRTEIERRSMYSLTADRWNVSALCSGYLDRMGLDMGVFDIAVTDHDEPVFFECNPNGQWEGMDAQASDAIADLIVSRLRDKAGR